MVNNKKIKNGLIKIATAICLLPGPVIFVLGSNTDNTSFIILNIIGWLMMLASIYLGCSGIKTIIDGLFDETNE